MTSVAWHLAQTLANVADPKPFLLQYIEWELHSVIEAYWDQFGPGLFHDVDFVHTLVQPRHFTSRFPSLPLTLRSDPVLLQLIVEYIPVESLQGFLRVIPSSLAAYEFIYLLALDRQSRLEPRQVPPTLWHNRDFVVKWCEKGQPIVMSCLGKELSNNRQVCLALYKCKFGKPVVAEADVRWISTTFLADKAFVLDCMNHHPAILECCTKELQEDFDVRLEAAFGAIRVMNSFRWFMDQLGKSFVLFARTVGRRIQPLTEFMTFLACSRKSRLFSILPLSVLDVDEATTRGLMTFVAQYLGFPNNEQILRLQCVWERIVVLVIEQKRLSTLVPLVCRKTIVQGVLHAIDTKRPVALRLFPNELWTNRTFVLWAATNGIFHKAIPDACSEDREICLAYYAHSPAVRKVILPWISPSLLSNRAFVMDCTDSDPLILSHCRRNRMAKFDFELLLNAVICSRDVDALVETAYAGGWTDLLITFSKLVRAKMEAHRAFQAFRTEARDHCFANVDSDSVTRLTLLIRAYFDSTTDTELVPLRYVWSNPSIFFLAIGGCIEDLCRANKFQPQLRMQVKKGCDAVSIETGPEAIAKEPTPIPRIISIPRAARDSTSS